MKETWREINEDEFVNRGCVGGGTICIHYRKRHCSLERCKHEVK